MTNITISSEFVNELQEVIEDAVEYTIREYASQGELISGESAYKIIEALALAKQAQFQGLID
jgi:citrate lyase synthetase